MNIYGINPQIIREDKFSILIKILKVKKIISFIDNYPSICEPLIIYKANIDFDNYIDSLNKNIKHAVYKFCAPMCSPKYDEGKWNNEFLIRDLYKNSKAYNPIYNMENCNDDNLLFFISDGCTDIIYEPFIKYSLNILKKYANEFQYDKKLCFTCFNDLTWEGDLYFCRTKMFHEGKFKSMIRYIPLKYHSEIKLKVGESYSFPPDKLKYPTKLKMNENGIFYDPLLSYINIKSKELYPSERKDSDIIDFFLGKSHLDFTFRTSIEEKINGFVDSYDIDDLSLE